MKRAKIIVHLTHQHHLALVLARRIKMNPPGSDAIIKIMKDFPTRWNDELAPHFAEEERTILPRLASEGATGMAERLRQDHDELRRLSALIIAGDPGGLGQFGALLYAHVRFEEREAFPHYERLIGAHEN